MQVITRRWILGFAAAATLGASAGASAQKEPVSLTVGSFNQGSSWYVYAVNLADVLRDVLPPGSKVDTPPIAGGVGNPRLVAEGKANLAFGMALTNRWGKNGEVTYKQAMPELRALVGGWDRYYLVPVANAGGVGPAMDKFLKQDRAGARVVLLPRGSLGSHGGLQLLQLLGSDEEGLRKRGGSIDFGSFDSVKSRFASRSADLFIHVVTAGHPAVTELAQNNKVTFLQPPQEALQEMSRRYGWDIAVMRKGTFPDQDSDLRVPATTTTLFASTRMPEDLAYNITKAICERTDRLRAAHQALAKFQCADDAWKEEVNGLPLHDGAARYYRERGWLK